MNKKYLFILILITLLVFFLVTCDFLPMSPDEYFNMVYNISTDSFSPPDKSFTPASGFELSWEGNEKIKRFHLQISESKDFTGNLVVDDNTLTTTSYSITQHLSKNQYYYWRVRFKNKSGEWEKWFATFSFYVIGILIQESFETNDGSFSTLNNWALGGNATPFVQSGTIHSGTWAAQFGSIGRTGESSFRTIVEFNTSKIISFYISTESRSGDFYFDIDSIRKYSLNGYTANSWARVIIPVDPGIHELKWYQVKAYDTDSATMWVDDIAISDIDAFVNDDFETNDGDFSTLNNWGLEGDAVPFVQNATVHNGSWAAQFGNIGQYGESSFRTIVEFSTSKIISFYISIESGSGEFYFDIDSTREYFLKSNTATSWARVIIPVEPGIHDLKWRQVKYYDTDSATMWVDDIAISDIDVFVNDDFETNDGSFSTLNNWGHGGNAIPFVQNATVHNGSWAAQFGNIGQTGESSFRTIVEFSTSKIISFYISTESRSGDFYFDIDSIRKYYLNGNTATSWTQIIILVEPGTHELKWRQVKYYDTDSATMWVDDIAISDIDAFVNDDFETNDGNFSTLNKWGLGGKATPFVQNTTVHNGSWAAQFGSIGRTGESYFQMIVEFSTSKIISFYISSESRSGYFYFDIDSIREYTLNGYTATSWTQIMISIEPGIHELKWDQAKYYDTDSATMWIDDIAITDSK